MAACTAERLANLAQRLRRVGIACSIVESLTGLDALPLLDMADEYEMRLGLRAVFCSGPSDLPVFDACFAEWWSGGPQSPPVDPTQQRGGGPSDRLGPAGPSSAREGAGTRQTATDEANERPFGYAWSAHHSIAQRTFAEIGERDLKEVDKWIDRLLVQLSARRSRRFEAGGRRGPVDLRRTIRSNLATDGMLFRLSHRRRRMVPPRLVVICDISGSMERYSRFLLRFLLGCARTREMETFAFSTELTHLTPWLRGVNVDTAMDLLRARGWSSGTRIGECLTTLVEEHGKRLFGRRTIVVIMSDGLDQGDQESLVTAMHHIQRASRRVVWLNPLLESSRYAPEARGMRAALPFVDHFESGHNLEALSRVIPLLGLQTVPAGRSTARS